MEPTLGWVLLSRDALKRAEDHLRDGEQGVRDEIGFLVIHQAYADRFFPGTSVLQTRLRYVLFVPWLYNDALRNTGHLSISKYIEDQERRLAKRLKESYERDQSGRNSYGVIGRRAYPKPTSQPPSMIYRTALSTWGLLRPQNDGSRSSRATSHRLLKHNQRNPGQYSVRDDDKAPIDNSNHLFISLPAPPDEWNNSQYPIYFDLPKNEQMFLKQQLSNVQRPNEAGTPSLLARLVEREISVSKTRGMWYPEILGSADMEDQVALKRAGQASALAAIGRAIYTALVEHICEQWDQRPVSTKHRGQLMDTITEYKENALRLETNAIADDAPNIADHSILEIFRETQRWLINSQNSNPLDLLDLFQQVEVSRKGNRARLARTLAAKERRMEWEGDKYPPATPLHYRWPTVRRLLKDLEETDE